MLRDKLKQDGMDGIKSVWESDLKMLGSEKKHTDLMDTQGLHSARNTAHLFSDFFLLNCCCTLKLKHQWVNKAHTNKSEIQNNNTINSNVWKNGWIKEKV